MDDLDNLDDILDRALEEFEDEEMSRISQANASAAGLQTEGAGAGVSADKLLKDQHAASVTQELHKMISDLEDPAHAEVLRQNYEALSGTAEGAKTLEDFLDQLKEKERLSAQGNVSIVYLCCRYQCSDCSGFELARNVQEHLATPRLELTMSHSVVSHLTPQFYPVYLYRLFATIVDTL